MHPATEAAFHDELEKIGSAAWQRQLRSGAVSVKDLGDAVVKSRAKGARPWQLEGERKAFEHLMGEGAGASGSGVKSQRTALRLFGHGGLASASGPSGIHAKIENNAAFAGARDK